MHFFKNMHSKKYIFESSTIFQALVAASDTNKTLVKKKQSQHMRDIERFMVKILQAPWGYQISQRQHTTTRLQICRGYLEKLFGTNYQFMHHHSYERNSIKQPALPKPWV